VTPSFLWHKDTILIPTNGKGLYPFTDQVNACIRRWNIQEGMCFLFIQHTSASILINENYDPSAQADMEQFFEKMVPENQAWMCHTLEGSDDSSSHLRSAVTPVSLSIPIDESRLSLGTWQGIYLFEHRQHKQHRQVLIRCLAVE
jgi:secondary thiamine-phosphate synthase enzyme